ncbi:MAG: CRISPR-associated endonuclease Cas3'' [Deltaproteobacteria bacterium]|nr:CRISPR-associated endonuclease Cas3'' [Deltaproteobacteria bacterium]
MTIDQSMVYAHIEGDRSQPLLEHLSNVAELSRSYASKIGLPLHGELIGLLHDFGKYSTEFQNYLKSATGLLNSDEDAEFIDAKGLKGKVDHSSAGAQFIWKELSSNGPLASVLAQVISICIASHHSGLIDCLQNGRNSPVEDTFSKRISKSDQLTHLAESLAMVDPNILVRAKELFTNTELLESFDSVVKDIVRRSPIQKDRSFVAQNHLGFLIRFLFSCLIDADRTDSAHFACNTGSCYAFQTPVDWTLLIDRMEMHLLQFEQRTTIDRIRKEISDSCKAVAEREKGIFTLTVPTGGGKTLAGLRFALHHASRHNFDRIISFIPFTSIIDQNAEVARQILECEGISPNSVVLEHHSNLTPELQTWRNKLYSENWDAPVIYTTLVQFLDALFGHGTRGARRMHQLGNAVLIFDEIQTLPVNCIHLFNNAVNFLVEQCGSTVILCTATQPLLQKVDSNLGAIRLAQCNEIMQDVPRLFDALKRVDILNQRKPSGWSQDDIASLAQEEAFGSGSCLVVANTKKTAQNLYRICAKTFPGRLYHLSTSMCPAHRKGTLQEIRNSLEGEGPTICVSTQLIEAGVDIDFGSVIRLQAGLDSIAQSAGRCNRHGKMPRPGRVHIVNLRDENLDMLPDIRIGRDKADRVLDDFDNDPKRFRYNCIGPEAMTWYYENYFFSRADEMVYPVPSSTLGHADTLLGLLSLNSIAVQDFIRVKNRQPDIYFRQSFMTAGRIFKAIDTPARGVIVPYRKEGLDIVGRLCEMTGESIDFTLLRKAQQYSVNVFPQFLEKLVKAETVQETQIGSGILFLADPRYYSSHFGLSEKPEEKMEVWDV